MERFLEALEQLRIEKGLSQAAFTAPTKVVDQSEYSRLVLKKQGLSLKVAAAFVAAYPEMRPFFLDAVSHLGLSIVMEGEQA